MMCRYQLENLKHKWLPTLPENNGADFHETAAIIDRTTLLHAKRYLWFMAMQTMGLMQVARQLSTIPDKYISNWTRVICDLSAMIDLKTMMGMQQMTMTAKTAKIIFATCHSLLLFASLRLFRSDSERPSAPGSTESMRYKCRFVRMADLYLFFK